MLISQNVPNLIGGVSQQAEALRFPSQCIEQSNFYPTILRGLSKRPPTTHVKKLATGDILGGSYGTHKIDRSLTERFKAYISGSSIRVFDLDGNEKTVTAPGGYGYLACSDPANDIRTLTVADYTFVLNKTKVVTAAAQSPTNGRDPEAMVMVKQVRDGANYTIKLYNNPASRSPDYTFTLNDVKLGSASTYGGRLVADQGDIINGLNALFGASPADTLYNHFVSGELLYLLKKDGSDFRIETECSVSEGMFAFKDVVQNFALLPKRGWANFSIKVLGDPDDSGDDYYLKFVAQAPNTGGFGEGAWQETQKLSLTDDALVASTMPHALIWNGSSFTFEPLAWVPRAAGDSDTNPVPSFVGGTIEDVFFRKNRLGFLTGGNMVLSCSGSFFNFFRTTVIQLLDSDVIDVAGAHIRDGTLYNAAQTAEKLVLFSATNQLVAEEGAILTPKSVGLTTASEYPSTVSVRPEVIGDSIFFPFKRGEYTSFIEYSVKSDTALFGGDEITEHVPRYIKGGLKSFAASGAVNVLVGLADDASTLHTYTFFRRGKERLQSSWFKFKFDGTIRGYAFFDTKLYVTLLRNGELVLEWMDLAPGLRDNKPDGSDIFVTHLDRRVTEAAATGVNYSTTTGLTTFTLPYLVNPTNIRAVKRSNSGYGATLPIVFITGNQVVVNGDHAADLLWFGEVYRSEMVLTKPALRAQNSRGEYVVSPGRYQVRTGTITADDTLDFRVEVTPRGRSTFSYSFAARVLGTDTAVTGTTIPSRSLPFRFPVNSKNDQVDISVVNDSYLPCNLLSLDWEALYAVRSRRV